MFTQIVQKYGEGAWRAAVPPPVTPLIYTYICPPIKVQSCVQNFLGKFPKVGIAPKNRLKNFQKKLDTLDFTYYQMVFIL